MLRTWGGTTERNKYESANHMADIGNKIREYIVNLASASAGATQEQAANTMGKTNQFNTMAAQIKALTNAVAKLRTRRRTRTQMPVEVGGRTGIARVDAHK